MKLSDAVFGLLLLALGGVASLCLFSTLWKWRGVGWKSRLVNAVVFYLYFTGRAVAGLRELLSRMRPSSVGA